MSVMNVKYHNYGENELLLMFLLVIMGVVLLIIKLLNEIVYISSDLVIVLWFLFLSFLVFIPIMLNRKAQFVADDYTVTFKKAFSHEICIPYITISEMNVYHEAIPARVGRCGSRRYVEIITFKTNDGEEYTFKALMDISPDSYVAAMLGTDKIFEMGKFKVLQRFIEQKRKDQYSSSNKF